MSIKVIRVCEGLIDTHQDDERGGHVTFNITHAGVLCIYRWHEGDPLEVRRAIAAYAPGGWIKVEEEP